MKKGNLEEDKRRIERDIKKLRQDVLWKLRNVENVPVVLGALGSV